MLTYKPKSAAPCVRYFYLPANSVKQAEVIQVLNSSSDVVQVPMREEDMVLTAFFERDLTSREKASYKTSETWKVFTCWEDVENDHVNFSLKKEVLCILLSLRYRYQLEEENIAVSA